jgi:hypothetical protein
MRAGRVAAWGGVAAFAALGPGLTSCGGAGPGPYSVPPVEILTTSVPPPATGQNPYSFTFTARVPHPPATWAVTAGALPEGLALDVRTGELRGVPRTPGSTSFEVTARDGPDPAIPPGGAQTYVEGRKRFVVVVAKGPPRLIGETLPAAFYRRDYAHRLDAGGGTPPYRFDDVSRGTEGLPSGFSVLPSGYVAGTSHEIADVRTRHAVRVRLTDADGAADERVYDLYLGLKPLAIYTESRLPPASAGFRYSTNLSLAATGGGAPFTWTQVEPGPGETRLADVDMELTGDGFVRSFAAAAGPRWAGSPYTIRFTAEVADQPGQASRRSFTLWVRQGPVLTSITPRRQSSGGPYTVRGLNFRPGAVLVFHPGDRQVVVTPTFVDDTTLTFGQVATPNGARGATRVDVVNPDGWRGTGERAFLFPAAQVSFGAPSHVSSVLSSTGLDCADVDGDGRADVLHAGAAGFSVGAGGPVGSTGGLHLYRNAGGSPPSFGQVVLDGGDWHDAKFCDVDHDGLPDVVAIGRSEVRTWRNGVGGDAPGVFSPGPASALPPGFGAAKWPSCLALGTLDGDLVPDLVFGVPGHPTQHAHGGVVTMLGDGQGGFTALESHLGTIPNTNGVDAVACLDADGNGRCEVVAGVGANPYWGPAYHVSTRTWPDGRVEGWTPVGGWPVVAAPPGEPVEPPAVPWAHASAVIACEDMGSGLPGVVVPLHGPSFSDPSGFTIGSGPGLTSAVGIQGWLPAVPKGGTAIDADFDDETDWAVCTHPRSVQVFRGFTRTLAAGLEAGLGLTGRAAAGDLDADGRPDLVVTTSFWAVDETGAASGGSHLPGLRGDGGAQGFVFFLNSSD